MNLVEHAKRELALAEMFSDDKVDSMKQWNNATAEAVVSLIELFAEQGHSGMSASMTIELFQRLGKFETLTPLTDNLAEWEKADDKLGYQSNRNPACFSEDMKVYWNVNDDVKKIYKLERKNHE